MKALAPFLLVVALVLAAWLGTAWGRLEFLFGVILPCGALAAFLIGITWRVLSWARSPVPFNITTTCGQQYSFPWIRSSRLGNPHTRWGVAGRLALEMFCFRSLLRNVTHHWVEVKGQEPKLVFKSSPWLWAGALAFHYSLLFVLLHHARFFLEPVPPCLSAIEGLDAFFKVGSVAFYLSGILLAGAVLFLLLRRFLQPWMRYLSLPADYFPLYLLLAIALTGGMMHYTFRTDIPSVKRFCISLASLHPVMVSGLGPLFYIHLTLVSVLFAYLPFSKLSHMASMLLSPTRNMAGASRMIPHQNPWNYPVKVHTYEEYEDEFRSKMKAVGLPVDKEAP